MTEMTAENPNIYRINWHHRLNESDIKCTQNSNKHNIYYAQLKTDKW